MLPFLAALCFMLILGKKIHVPVSALLALAGLLCACYFFTSIDTNFVLITLFVASPILIHYRWSNLTRVVFMMGVILPLAVDYAV